MSKIHLEAEELSDSLEIGGLDVQCDERDVTGRSP